MSRETYQQLREAVERLLAESQTNGDNAGYCHVLESTIRDVVLAFDGLSPRRQQSVR